MNPNNNKKRLDVLLTEMGLASSRERARALIMAGKVFVNGQKEDKPGTPVKAGDCDVTVKGDDLPYVSRGGLKLEKALKVFEIDLKGLKCMDIGASTGGFTDCMLQNGAAGVMAVDVGFGQLDWKLRNDERVEVFEKTNFRYFERPEYKKTIDFISVDVSFISLTKLLSQALSYLKDDGSMVCLIKPQFEAGRENVGKKGVVRDPNVHFNVITDVIKCADDLKTSVSGLDFSPIRGPEGNIEYLLYLKKQEEKTELDTEIDVMKIVEEAHASFGS